MGVFSVRDPGFIPREIDVLAHLTPGEVSSLLDSREGYQVLRRRTVAPSTPVLAMIPIQIPVRHEGHPDAQEAEARAMDLMLRVRRDPKIWESAEQEYCCPTRQRWHAGYGRREFERAIERVAVDEIVDQLFREEDGVVIIRRASPIGDYHPGLTFQLPSPTRPDLDAILANNSGPAIAAAIRELRSAVEQDLALTELSRTAALSALDLLAKRIEREEDPQARVRFAAAFWSEVKSQLPEDQYTRLQQFVETWTSSQLMRRGGE
jgi:hypothetical protein